MRAKITYKSEVGHYLQRFVADGNDNVGTFKIMGYFVEK